MNALIYKGNRAAGWLGRYSVDILRVSLGLIFLGFGVLKFFPGASPAEALVMRTLDTLTLGIVHGRSAVLLTALMECCIGITLVTGRFLRTGLMVLGFSLVGIMSPLVLFFGDLFPGTPTLEAQYVLKDFVLAAAGLVVAAKALTAVPLRIGGVRIGDGPGRA
jgi:putative oxidoreductase